MRIALAQLNQTVGDLGGNLTRVVEAIEQAESRAAQVVCLPELALTGYPPEDLVLKTSFVKANRQALERAAGHTRDALAVIGFVDRRGDRLYNAAAVCSRGEVRAVYHKQLLPNYGVFDERRYFEPGRENVLLDTPAGVVGVCICEDLWEGRGPVQSQGDAGAQVVVNINASPFHKNKLAERAALLRDRARGARASIVYVNLVGGQDELVFDGGSLVVDAAGDIVARLAQFEEAFAVVDVPLGEARATAGGNVRRVSLPVSQEVAATDAHAKAERLGESEEIYRALELALRDYVRKNGFDKVVVGLSGGIDSTLTAVVAADAVGPDRVLGIAMPSTFSSSHSLEDARKLAANLGIDLLEIPITGILDAYTDALEQAFGRADPGLAEENLQARIRGNLLMATSNRYGHLVVATGNKSELACGYATLYGDMAGGFALLKDVFKTEVYDVARYRNSLSAVIPQNVFDKPPSAELRPGQRDSDSLPPYEELDPILQAYIHEDAGLSEIVAAGHDAATVEKVIALVDRAEYKRRQAPPGPKVTTKAFGRDRRLPITNRWREGGPFEFPARAVGERPPDAVT